MEEGAAQVGLEAKVWAWELDDLTKVEGPAILHWEHDHWVVMEYWSGSDGRIVDPARGRRTVERQEFGTSFTGVGITLRPRDQFHASDAGRRPRSWPVLVRHALRAPRARVLALEVVASSLLLQLLGLAIPLLTALLVDHVLPRSLRGHMPVIGSAVGVIVLCQFLTSWLRAQLLVQLSVRMDLHIMSFLLRHLTSLPYGYFESRSSGDLLQRLASGSQLRMVLSHQTISGMLDGLLVFVYGIVLFFAARPLSMVTFSLAAIQVVILVTTMRATTERVKLELSSQGEAQGFFVETLHSIGALKASGLEGMAARHGNGLFSKQADSTVRRGELTVFVAAATLTIQRFSPLILLYVGGVQVLRGQMTLGFMLAMVSLSQNFLGPLATLVASGMQFQLVGGHVERIASVLEQQPEQSSNERRQRPVLKGRLEFDRVSFRYSGDEHCAVERLSVRIEPGQKVAFVGPSGSGKSTTVKLLLGLYEAQEGAILLDGLALTELDLHSVREQFGVVTQEPFVFNGSIRENITCYGELPEEAVERAARLAELEADIQSQLGGYDSLVGEGGSSLSGGQRQRLMIARALARDPKILVLDEATSALDMVTEQRVAENLRELGCTTVVIAHRLSTVRDANTIVVLDRGRTVQVGCHESLIAQPGLYRDLVRGQLLKEHEEDDVDDTLDVA